VFDRRRRRRRFYINMDMFLGWGSMEISDTKKYNAIPRYTTLVTKKVGVKETVSNVSNHNDYGYYRTLQMVHSKINHQFCPIHHGKTCINR